MSAFVRPGSPGRLSGEARQDRPNGGLVAWFGPVFWPYAYDDMVDYAFWPADYDKHGEALWVESYHDVAEGLLWPDIRSTLPGAAIAPGGPPTPTRSRAGVRGLDGQSREFAEICGDRTPGLYAWPLHRIEQTLGASAPRRVDLAALGSAMAAAAKALKAACPDQDFTTPLGRLDAMARRLAAMRTALDLMRPAVEAFYDTLNDAQKMRFEPSQTRRDRPGAKSQEEQPALSSGDDDVAQACYHAIGTAFARDASGLERALRPTEAQRGAWDGLGDAVSKAAQVLKAACPTDLSPVPAGRLDAMQHRLDALLEATRTLRPALAQIYAVLTDQQRSRFDAMGRQARPTKEVICADLANPASAEEACH